METVEHLGQYYTTHYQLKRTIFSFILNQPKLILEPCIGRGDLVRYIVYKIPGVSFDMFEIDPTIPYLRNIKKKDIIIQLIQLILLLPQLAVVLHSQVLIMRK